MKYLLLLVFLLLATCNTTVFAQDSIGDLQKTYVNKLDFGCFKVQSEVRDYLVRCKAFNVARQYFTYYVSCVYNSEANVVEVTVSFTQIEKIAKDKIESVSDSLIDTTTAILSFPWHDEIAADIKGYTRYKFFIKPYVEFRTVYYEGEALVDQKVFNVIEENIEIN